jgi:hypothetical protein
MSAVLFDTHEVVRNLKAAGFTDEQAEAVTRLVRDTLTIDLPNLATKTDLAPFATKIDHAETKAEIKTDLAGTKAEIKTDLSETKAEIKTELAEIRAEIKIELAEIKAEILKWMVSSIGIQTVVIIGAVGALVRMHR